MYLKGEEMGGGGGMIEIHNIHHWIRHIKLHQNHFFSYSFNMKEACGMGRY